MGVRPSILFSFSVWGGARTSPAPPYPPLRRRRNAPHTLGARPSQAPARLWYTLPPVGSIDAPAPARLLPEESTRHHVRPEPLGLPLVRRRPPAWGLPAVRVRQGHPPVHGAAAPRLRARAHQGQRARREALREKAGLNPDAFLLRKAGQLFFNTSPLDLKKLMGDQDHIGENLRAYVQAFSPAVRDIFESFEFHTQIDKLAKAKLLYLVT